MIAVGGHGEQPARPRLHDDAERREVAFAAGEAGTQADQTVEGQRALRQPGAGDAGPQPRRPGALVDAHETEPVSGQRPTEPVEGTGALRRVRGDGFEARGDVRPDHGYLTGQQMAEPGIAGACFTHHAARQFGPFAGGHDVGLGDRQAGDEKIAILGVRRFHHAIVLAGVAKPAAGIESRAPGGEVAAAVPERVGEW